MSPGFVERGGWWVLAQSVLMLAVIGLGVTFQGDWSRLPVIGLGAALLVLGGIVGVAGMLVLSGSRTPFPKPLPGARLVQHGIYQHIRHPLYTSVMLASMGWALIWQSWPALLVALVLIPFFDAKARREERWLSGTFPEYATYRQRVRRFIPWIY